MRWIAILLLISIAAYAAVMLDVAGIARTEAYFEAHPDELRAALDACREGWFSWPECDNAEAAATF